MATSQLKVFGDTAKSLSRNPLGIVALFIVMVYGFACLVTAFAGSFDSSERLPLIYFLVTFPVLVLGVFMWLVSCHSNKLFAPSDFKDEENYMDLQRMQMEAVASLGMAAAKGEGHPSGITMSRLVDIVSSAGSARISEQDGWRNRILWVDDRPDNNIYERSAFEAVGIQFTNCRSTAEALSEISRSRFTAIISDMDRVEGPDEGYVLLDQLRGRGNHTPLFFYTSSATPEDSLETQRRGGQGCTNDAGELFDMVMKSIVERQTAV